MQSVAKFVTKAYPVSGCFDYLSEVRTEGVSGRVRPACRRGSEPGPRSRVEPAARRRAGVGAGGGDDVPAEQCG